MIWNSDHIQAAALKGPDVVSRFCANADTIGPSRRPTTVAIVGGGPKGFYAVERLVYALAKAGQLAETAIHWFNTDRWFGVGSNFRTDQPEFLLINNSIGTIDTATLPGDRHPFVKWINQNRLGEFPLATHLDFASRALVGFYLSDAVVHFLTRLPKGTDVRLLKSRVTHIVQSDGNLRILVAGGGTEQELPVAYQSVMLATGHSYSQRHPVWTAFAEAFPDAHYMPQVYPLNKLNRIAAGKPVAIQGLGLTFVDAVLALTEGRGGVFTEKDGVGLTYRPSGYEPSLIIPFSRSNLPMIARSPVDATSCYRLRFVTKSWADNLRSKYGAKVDFETDIVPILEREMAHAYHRTAWQDFDADDATMDCRIAALPTHQRFAIDRFLFGSFPVNKTASKSHHEQMLGYLQAGLEAAEKGEQKSPLMAAAGVWREAVPIIRELYAHGGFTGDAHRVFNQRYYGALNRVAFGPPVANMKKILCLAQAGYIQFLFSTPPQIQLDRQKQQFIISADSNQIEVPALVDARIARLNLAAGNAALFVNLLASGTATPMVNGGFQPGCPAISPNGYLLGADGKETKIAVYGTPTEGVTLDNDSLSPACNDLATPWAQTVAADMTQQKSTQHPIV